MTDFDLNDFKILSRTNFVSGMAEHVHEAKADSR